MRAFASFILKGRLQAILVALVAAVLSLILPPISHLSVASVALVTLRKGLSEAVIITAAVIVAIFILGRVSSLEWSLVQVFVLAMLLSGWLPVMLCALVLRNSRSLGLALTLAGGLVLAGMMVFYLLLGDVSGWWLHILRMMFEPLMTSASTPLSPGEIDTWLTELAATMTGLVGGMLIYSMMINLCLARWWQAMLFNPAGFGKEFRQLRLDWRISAVALVLMLVSGLALGGVQGFTLDFMLLVIALFSIQGLALVHAIVKARQMAVGWLFGMYLLLLLALPQVAFILAAAGLTDSWLDFRRRLKIVES